MRIKADAMWMGKAMWTGTDRWPQWRKAAKRISAKRSRQQSKKFCRE